MQMMTPGTEGEEVNQYEHQAVSVVAVIGHVDYLAGADDSDRRCGEVVPGREARNGARIPIDTPARRAHM